MTRVPGTTRPRRPELVGCVSTYDEGPLAVAAVESLRPAVDAVYVHEGPIGAAAPSTAPRHVGVGLSLRHGAWESDAAKRTDLYRLAAASGARWALILDGDELLVNGDQVRTMIWAYEQNLAADGTDVFALPLRIVELDGSCAMTGARLLRIDRISRVLLSSYQLELDDGVTVALPNVPLCLVDEPDSSRAVAGHQCRRPLPGEPCILHRSVWRSPARQAAAERLHVAERRDLEATDLVTRVGLERPADDATRLWLPSR